MMHPSNEDLLDLALTEKDGEREKDIRKHLRTCKECERRYQDVETEQNLIRRAFEVVEPPAELRARFEPQPVRKRWLGWAALVAVSLGVGVLSFQAWNWRGDSRRLKDEVVQLKKRLKNGEPAGTPPSHEGHKERSNIVGKRNARWAAFISGEEVGYRDAVMEMVSEAEEFYLHDMQHFFEEKAPISEAQEKTLHKIVHRFASRQWTEKDRARLTAQYKEAMRAALTKKQLPLFKEFSKFEAESNREDEVDWLTDELSEVLDLRYSESLRIQNAFESGYPAREMVGLFWSSHPADALLDDNQLAGKIRLLIPEETRKSYDSWLDQQKKLREKAEELVRK